MFRGSKWLLHTRSSLLMMTTNESSNFLLLLKQSHWWSAPLCICVQDFNAQWSGCWISICGCEWVSAGVLAVQLKCKTTRKKSLKNQLLFGGVFFLDRQMTVAKRRQCTSCQGIPAACYAQALQSSPLNARFSKWNAAGFLQIQIHLCLL